MTLNEIFGEPRTLCGWLVDKNLVRLQTRDPRFRESIQHLNRDKSRAQRPRLVATGTNVYLRTFELPMKPEDAQAFVQRQLGRVRETQLKAA